MKASLDFLVNFLACFLHGFIAENRILLDELKISCLTLFHSQNTVFQFIIDEFGVFSADILEKIAGDFVN